MGQAVSPHYYLSDEEYRDRLRKSLAASQDAIADLRADLDSIAVETLSPTTRELIRNRIAGEEDNIARTTMRLRSLGVQV